MEERDVVMLTGIGLFLIGVLLLFGGILGTGGTVVGGSGIVCIFIALVMIAAGHKMD